MPNYLSIDQLQYPSPALECLLKDLICKTTCRTADQVSVVIAPDNRLTVTVNGVSASVVLSQVLPTDVRVTAFGIIGSDIVITLSNGMQFPVGLASLIASQTLVTSSKNNGALTINVNGVPTTQDLCSIVHFCETPTTLTQNNNLYTFTNEKGVVTTFIAGGGVSSQAGNLAVLGPDNKVFVPRSGLTTEVFQLTTGNTVTTAFIPVVGTDMYVLRNGVRRILGVDFIRTGAVYTFTTPFGVSNGATGIETVVIDYFKP